MRLPFVALAAISTLLATPDRARSQQGDARNWSTTLAGAAGSGEVTCDLCDGERKWAPGGYVRVGQEITPRLTVSAELDLWRKSSDWTVVVDGVNASGTSQFTLATLNAVAQFYPVPTFGLFVEGGLGVGRYQASSKSRDVGGTRTYSNAFGYLAGAGYDIPLTRHVSLTPSVKVFGFVGAKVPDTDGKVGANVRQVALGLTFR
jgi:hypothetical protein